MREEPCTDSYARFCGQTEASASSDPMLFSLSKSRINFLDLLRAEHKDYVVNAGDLEYMQQQGLPKAKVAVLEAHGGQY